MKARPSPDGDPRLLGAILAGGESRRFGSPKALAVVGGLTLAERARRSLVPHVGAVILVCNDPRVGRALAPLPTREDLRPGLGPAGGVLTALHEARGRGCRGALVLACDLPLVPSGLLGVLADRLGHEAPVAPASPGPLGFEPLCGAYPVASLDAVVAFLEEGTGPAHALFRSLGGQVLPPEGLAPWADPAEAFLNVNTRADARRAEARLRGAAR